MKWVVVAIIGGAGLAAGCGDKDAPAPTPHAQVASVQPAPVAAPAAPVAPGSALPAGHPPLGAVAPTIASRPTLPANHPPIPPAGMRDMQPAGAAPLGRTIEAEGVAFDAPKGWVREAPSSRMRLAQFRLAGPAGDGEVSVVVAGGSAEANITRWVDQFEGTPRHETLQLERAGRTVTKVEIEGTFIYKAAPMAPGPGTPMADAVVRAVIIPGASGRAIFIKAWGPKATMASWAGSFDALVESLRAL